MGAAQQEREAVRVPEVQESVLGQAKTNKAAG